jgi:hypothetical protein
MNDERRRLLIAVQLGIILGFLLAGATMGAMFTRTKPPDGTAEKLRLAEQREELDRLLAEARENIHTWKSSVQTAEAAKRQLEYELQKVRTRITALEAQQKP